jgi:hypothetical protein
MVVGANGVRDRKLAERCRCVADADKAVLDWHTGAEGGRPVVGNLK